MTLRTSLFNKGIYKSTIKRFAWGAVLYFAVLFMLTGMMILINEEPGAIEFKSYMTIPYLLDHDMLVPGILVGIVVPTVTAMLVYRFVHSRKQSVFTHSLPVSRVANYISTVFGGLTLMAAPIILNGIVLMIISASGYGALFTIKSCFAWMIINLLCVFVLFSYSTLVAMITGNTFAVLVLNIVIHLLLIMVLGGVDSLSRAFLYGYPSSYEFWDFIDATNPIVWIFEVMQQANNTRVSVDRWTAVCHVIAAVAVYVIAFVLYKKRRLETAEDVAGFKKIAPAYKYILTLLSALAAFGVAAGPRRENPGALIWTVIIVSAVVYFGSEMALKKTLRVWKSYKGYLCFAGIFGIIVATFAMTSFFGFESRVPKIENIESVAIRTYISYMGDEYLDDEEIKKLAVDVHKEILSSDTAKEKWFAGYSDADLYINYKLRNGNMIYRTYNVDYDKSREITGRLYEYEIYKQHNEKIFREGMMEPGDITVNGVDILKDIEGRKELVECIRKDVSELSYNQMYWGNIIKMCEIPVEIEYPVRYDSGMVSNNQGELRLNPNYKNTMQWLRDSGYWDRITWEFKEELYICDDTWDQMPAKDSNDILPRDEDLRYVPLYKINTQADWRKLEDFIYNHGIAEEEDKKYYALCKKSVGGKLDKYAYVITDIAEDDLPSLLNLLEAEEKLQ